MTVLKTMTGALLSVSLGAVGATAQDAPITNPADAFALVQSSAGTVIASQGFTDVLRPGAAPVMHDYFAGQVPTSRVAGPSVFNGGRLDSRRTAVWASGLGASVDAGRSDGQTPLYAKSFGAAFGVERDIGIFASDHAAIGLAGGYQNTDLDIFSGGTMDVQSWSAGIYGGSLWGPFRTDLALSYTGSDIEASGLSDRTAGDTDGQALSARAEVAVRMAGDSRRGFIFSPFLRAMGTFAEFETPAGQSGTPSLHNGDFDSGALGVGARIGFNNSSIRSNDSRFTLEAAYERSLGDEALAFDFGDVGLNERTYDTVFQSIVDADRLHVGSTAALELMNALDLSIRYDGRIGEDVVDHRASVRAGVRF